MNLQRFYEIVPGAVVWGTLIGFVLASWLIPLYTAVAVILYDLFWLVRTIYLYFHLRVSFKAMRRNLRVSWLEKLEEIERDGKNWRQLTHLVILPMVREPYAVVKETLATISQSKYPLKNIFVVLAVEERGGKESKETAERIRGEFGAIFGAFLITLHPADLPGEIPGKGSNETWGAREAKKKLIDPKGMRYENIIVSVLDIDTQVPREYFGRLTYVFLTTPFPLRSSYQPLPLFLNNVHEAPAFSRVISFFPTFWQMMQQSRSEQLSTFTSQAMPWQALVEVDFWDRDLVTEDSLIFWRFFNHYDGDWRTVPLHFPVSMDVNAAPTLWQTVKNLYRQQRRWAWGSENIPYMMTRFHANKKIPLRTKVFWAFIFMEGFWAWATAPFIMFAAGYLPILLGGEEFNATLISYNLPRMTSLLMTIMTSGLALSAILSSLLLPPRPEWFRWYHYFLYVLEWALAPVILIFLSGIPALEAQTRLMLGGRFRLGYWVTPKSRAVEQTGELPIQRI